MRVITGQARGRPLKAVPGMDVRPTAEKVKEGVFSAIQFEVEGARMLDLFCGTGQMGIEGLSRGAQSCIFVDLERRSVDTARANLEAAGLSDRARILRMDAEAFLTGSGERFDIAFLDPPYSKGFLQRLLPLLAGRMSDSGVILAEHEEKDILPPAVSAQEGVVFVLTKKYRYARISVSAYRRGEEGCGKESESS